MPLIDFPSKVQLHRVKYKNREKTEKQFKNKLLALDYGLNTISPNGKMHIFSF